MLCSLCLSSNQEEFPAEICIYLRGSSNVTRPTVGLFPNVVVCLDCGASRFMTPEDELAQLAGMGEART